MIVYVSHGQKCHSILAEDGTVVSCEVPELCADHEEADTRMLLHANHAAKDSRNIIIRSDDTNVFAIALATADKVSATLYMMMGPSSNSRIVSVSALSRKLGCKISAAVIVMHCFTGCDTVSTFKGKGNIKAYKSMIKCEDYIEKFSKLGEQWDATD